MICKNIFLKNGISSIFLHETSPEVWFVKGNSNFNFADNSCANVTDEFAVVSGYFSSSLNTECYS